MRRWLACGVGLALWSVAAAEPATQSATRPAYARALGVALEEWEYPHPVRFLALEVEGESVRMAYMDVPAKADAKGVGGGRAIVLMHGKNFWGGYFVATIEALSAAGFRVIVPDQLGFGKSAKPDVEYSFDLLAANTAKLLNYLKVERAAVLGHSMGGMLAVRFARDYPKRTTHLILENPIGLEDYRQRVPPRSDDEVFREEMGKSAESVRNYFKTYFVEWRGEYERLVEVHARVMLSGEYPRWARSSARTFQMIYRQPVRHEFSLIEAPTLLVIGQEDRTAIGRAQVTPEVGKAMGRYPELGRAAAKDIPKARLVELDGVGHIPHLESPEKFHAAVLEFLRE